MRKTITSCVVSVLTVFCLGGCSPDGQVNAAAAPAKATGVSDANDNTVAVLAKGCLGCHGKGVSLADIPASEMPKSIKSVISAEVAHPTVVPKLTDDQVVALAKLLQQP